MRPNKSPERMPIGTCSLRSQRRHNLVAQQETFAARIVVTVAVHVTRRRCPANAGFLRYATATAP
jgi:hypothetical protein